MLKSMTRSLTIKSQTIHATLASDLQSPMLGDPIHIAYEVAAQVIHDLVSESS